MILVRSPMRISLFGGGTDYIEYIKEFGGLCVGFAINQYSYVSSRVLPPYFEYKTRLAYSEIECVEDNKYIKHNAIRNVIQYLGKKDNALEIQHWSDVPSFTGLGSSSAFIVSLLKSLGDYNDPNPEELINSAFIVENGLMGKNVGVQDATFAAVGGIGGFRFRKRPFDELNNAEDSIEVKYRFFPGEVEQFFNNNGLLFFTGKSRNSSDVVGKYVGNLIYNEHQHRIRDIAEKAYKVLLDGCTDIDRIAYMLNGSWFCKKNISPHISTPEFDAFEKNSINLPIAGFKLLGGGGGGSVFMLVEPQNQEEVIAYCKSLGWIHIPYQICGGAERIL